MTNQVEIFVRGVQHYGDGRDEEPVVVETDGLYRKVGGRHHIRYDEILSGTTEKTRSHLAISQDRIEVRKSGEAAADMVFEAGNTHETRYRTRFGTLLIEMRTRRLTVREDADALYAEIAYALYANREKVADCTMEIRVKSKA